MKCVNVLGGSSRDRLDCSAALARLLSGRGWRVAYLAPWNRSGDPDPYQSSPFQELHLVSPEAGLSYHRPGRGIGDVIPSVSADWLIVDGIPIEGSMVVACGMDHPAGSPVAAWGVSIPGIPAVDDPSVADRLEAVAEGCASATCGRADSTDHVEVSVSGRALDLSGFPSRVVESVILGLVSTLRGYSDGGDITIRILRDKV